MGSMDPDPPPLPLPAPRCSCACHCCASSPAPWRRSVKRRLDDANAPVPSRELPDDEAVAARVEAGDEVAALREALASHQQTVQELCVELDEERSAASTAASETMSMILRLQREKAEAQMEARQFRRLAEERMAHDQRELDALEDLLFRRDQALQSLSLQLQSYKHRLLSLGIDPEALIDHPAATPRAADDDPVDLPAFDYPPLRCMVPADVEFDGEDENADLEKYAETPQIHEDLQNLEFRIYQLERTPSSSRVNVMEKGVVERGSSAGPAHFRRSSADSYGSAGSSSFTARKPEEFPLTVDRASNDEFGGDDMNDRVYTIDAVHGPLPVAGVSDELEDTPREVGDKRVGVRGGEEEGDIKKLYARLQALEADRESMRQAIISMRTEKAQLVLLREIAQHLCKEVAAPQQKKVLKKPPSLMRSLSIMSVIKWILSFIFWRKKASRTRYSFGQSNNNVGLLLLLDKSPRMGQWTCLSRIRG